MKTTIYYNVALELIDKEDGKKYIAVTDSWMLPQDGNTKETLDLTKRPEARLTYRIDEHTTRNSAVYDLLRNYHVEILNVEEHAYFEDCKDNVIYVNHKPEIYHLF